MGTATVILGGDESSGNSIYANQGFGTNQAGTSGQTMAGYNWWGDASGRDPMLKIHLGTGEEVTDRAFYDPWLIRNPQRLPLLPLESAQLASPNEVSVGQTVNIGVLFQKHTHRNTQ